MYNNNFITLLKPIRPLIVCASLAETVFRLLINSSLHIKEKLLFGLSMIDRMVQFYPAHIMSSIANFKFYSIDSLF